MRPIRKQIPSVVSWPESRTKALRYAGTSEENCILFPFFTRRISKTIRRIQLSNIPTITNQS